VTGNLMRRLAVVALPLALAACDPNDWLTDMKQQPSIGTWQKFSSDSAAGDTIPFRGNPQGSVPTNGIAVASWQVSYAAMPATIDSLSGVANPVAADARSLENGHKLYQINCAVCHGDLGDGNGALKQLNPMYGFAPPVNGAVSQARTDGYLFGMLRNGRGLMPPQNRIPEEMRWDVVNYLRGLQGRYAVQTGPVGFPGQTGTALPGYSKVGPTVPHPYARPSTTGITPKAEKPAGEAKADPAHNGGHE
jgi:mono/diheme cytochrome c family protein